MFQTEKEEGAISTVVIRGSTDNLMDDIERAVDDGVNTFKVLVRVSPHCKINIPHQKSPSILRFLSRSSILKLFDC